MLKDISSIKITGVNFNGDKLPLFNKNGKQHRVSLLYGKNGSGKSTISKAFHKVSGKEENSIVDVELLDVSESSVELNENEKKQIFVFNEDFVDNNIRIDEEGLEAIVILGEQKEIQEKIDKITKQQTKQQELYDLQKKECDKYADRGNVISPFFYQQEMITKLKERWAECDRKIKDNRTATAVNKTTYEKFITRTPNLSLDVLLEKYKDGILDYENSKAGKTVINTSIKTDYNFNFDDDRFIEALAKKIEQPILTEREKFILSLLKEKGSDYVTSINEYFVEPEHKTCPFCLQPVTNKHRDELRDSIEKILSKVADEHKHDLLKFKLQPLNIDFDLYKNLDDNIVEKCKLLLNELNILIEQVNQYIIQKTNDVYTPIVVSPIGITNKVNELVLTLKELEKNRQEYNKQASDIESKKKNLIEINNDIAYWEVIESSKKYNEQFKAKKKEDDTLANIKTKLTSFETTLQQLNNEKRNVNIAVNIINKGLRYIFFAEDRLSIECIDGKYHLKSHGKSVSPKMISVGERNAMALCYFFSTIMNNTDEKDLYNKGGLIVIDDPISSFDIENKVGIMSYLKYKLEKFLLGNVDTKVLIMTHDIQSCFDMNKFLLEIGSSCKDRFNTQGKNFLVYWELANQSISEFMIKKRQEYTSLLHDIYSYAQNIDSRNSLTIGNSMRKVLEAFSTFVYKKSIADISTDIDVMAKIQEPYRTYFSNLMYRLVLHGGSHMEESVMTLADMDFFDYITDEQKQRTARDIICFLYLLNDVHICKHLKENEFQTTISSWLENIKCNFRP